MKKTALLAAAAALFAATPALAQSGGHIGGSFTQTEDETETWQVDGAFGGASGSIGYQIDAGLGQIEGDANTQAIAGHLYWNGGGWRVGGVVAFTNFDDEVDETSYGIEGSFDAGANAVFVGSYTVGETFVGQDADTWNADIGLNYYFTDNLRVGGTIGTGNLEATGADADTSTFGLNAEWQPWTTPVSFTFGWQSFEIDVSDEAVDSFSIGARWNFGGTLRERDNATPFDTDTAYYQRLFAVQ